MTVLFIQNGAAGVIAPLRVTMVRKVAFGNVPLVQPLVAAVVL